MIELEASQFFTVLLAIALAGAAAILLFDLLSERRLAKRARRNTLRCRICGIAYRRQGAQTVQPCPECGSPNRRGRDRRLG